MTTQKIRQSLTKKGFIEDKSHHCNFILHNNGEKFNVRTRISHGTKECGDKILGLMAQQLHLKRKDFDNFIDCQLDKDTYMQMLMDKGAIKPSSA
ncbi:MAG: hypothetical protein LBC63_09295 [Holophagales bacterium]|jgi:predicted transcriptional regulator|nr:hypothetical protein [Holophagales bacterium]